MKQKMASVMENLLEIGFSENCMINDEDVIECYKLMDNIKILFEN